MKYINKKLALDVWRLSRGFWTSEEKWKAIALAVAILTIQVVYVSTMVHYNSWQKDFYGTLQEADINLFFFYLKYWPMYMVWYIFMEVNRDYLMQALEIRWRTWIVDRYVGSWLGDKTYYLLSVLDDVDIPHVDNPDQRISDDIRLFVNYVLSLTLGMFNAVMKLCSFSVVLWNISGIVNFTIFEQEVAIHGYLVWLAIGYALLGVLFTVYVGNPIVKLNYHQQEYEANFRFGLARIREYAESIASYVGERQEVVSARQRFDEVRANFYRLMKRQWKLSWVTSLHWRVSFLVPYLVCAPKVFAGEMNFGGIMQTVNAFQQVENSLAYIVLHYYSATEASFAQLQTIVARLGEFDHAMKKAREVCTKTKLRYISTVSNAITLSHLTLEKPDGKVILEDFSCTIEAGERVMVTGVSGRGKSTLLKALLGIWPYGDGEITVPQDMDSLFLSQKAYMPMGRLRDILSYPQGDREKLSDERLKELLALVGLSHLTAALDSKENWGQHLSLGEQQRVAFIRLFLKKPKWIFLDEATSALDTESEARMYELLSVYCPEATVISVAHRLYLEKYHDKRIDL